MRTELTAREKRRVESALKKAKFTDITWRFDTVTASHKSHDTPKAKGICDLITGLGFFVPCGGITDRAYAQVWKE